MAQRNWWAAAVACTLAVLCSSCHWTRGDRPNILLIVVDTLRADRLGCYGNPRALTPFLDELAAKGALFRHAYATSSWTCPSVASLFTSRFPTQHHVTSFQSALHENEVTLAETLRTAGWTSGAYVANLRLLSSLGYAQGFERWWVDGSKEIRGPTLRRRSSVWLGQPSLQPRLLYLHYMEPHAPYDPPEPYRSRWQRAVAGVDAAAANGKLRAMSGSELSREEADLLESLYDGEVATLDAELRALFAELEQSGFLDHAIIVVTADHGEEFHEHGSFTHGTTLYNEVVHVPLLVVASGLQPGSLIDENVSLVDVAPTILELAGLPPEPRHEGRSLVPLMRPKGAAPPEPAQARSRLRARPKARPVLLELESVGAGWDPRAHSKGIVLGGLKLLTPTIGVPIVYHLGADPGEIRPNAVRFFGSRRRQLERVLMSLTADLRQRQGIMVKGDEIDEATREKLRALGYQF